MIACCQIVILTILILLSQLSTGQSHFNSDSLNYYKKKLIKYRSQDSTKFNESNYKILSFLENTQNRRMLFSGYEILGNLNRLSWDFETAIRYYFKALNHSPYAQTQLDVARIYDNLARIYFYRGESGLMFEAINKSLEIKNKKLDKKGIIVTTRILSDYYRSIGNYSEVLRNSFNALPYFIKSSDTIEIARTYNAIGITYKTIGDLDKANYYYQLSESYYRAINHDRGISTVLNNIGASQLALGMYQDALTNFLKGLEVEKEIGDKRRILTRYNNIGLAYAYLGNFEASREYLQKCIDSYKNSGYYTRLANSYESYAQLLILKGQQDTAKYYLKKAYNKSERLGQKNLQAVTALKLSELYLKESNVEQALSFLLKNKELENQLSSNELISNITEAEFNFIRNRELEYQKAEKWNALYKTFFIIAVLTILALLSIILILILSRKVRINRKVATELTQKIEEKNNELDYKGKELLSKTLMLGNENSQVSYAIKQLENLKSEFSVQGKHKIQQILVNLKSYRNNTIWDEFELRFSEVKSSFYNDLISTYPNLTVTEKRLICLIHLNFTTKEIANITKQSYRSILVAKSRLRKKLQIPQTTELSNFFSETIV